jgi:hypothetical protein
MSCDACSICYDVCMNSSLNGECNDGGPEASRDIYIYYCPFGTGGYLSVDPSLSCRARLQIFVFVFVFVFVFGFGFGFGFVSCLCVSWKVVSRTEHPSFRPASDCHDCGTRDPRNSIDPDPEHVCSNVCSYADDGECDDGGLGSIYLECIFGTVFVFFPPSPLSC